MNRKEYSGKAAVPVDLCVCPECGSPLTAECIDFTTSGKPTAEGLFVDCTAENMPHRYYKSEWLFILSIVGRWYTHPSADLAGIPEQRQMGL